MSYLVLARRERPQLFADVVGQRHVVRTLQNAIRSNRVHHAYLFCGTRGVGKTSTARILAKALNCDNGPGPEPCNQCTACKEITDGSAVDVIEVDAATHRGVEEAQRFLEGVPYRPSRLRYKFYIIDEVHMMTRHAFNALLKTFEEPPAHVKFVLATTEAHQVPDTILSRCQRFDFRELGTEEIADALARILDREGVAVSARARSWVVREARGSMRDALSLLDQVLAFAGGSAVSDDEVREVLGGVEVELVEDAIRSLVAREPDRMLGVIAEVVARGHDIKSFLASLLDALRAAMVAKAAPKDTASACEDAIVRFELFDDASLEDVVRWIDQGLRCQVELQRAEEPRLTLETALVRSTLLAPVRPLAEAVARLEAIEARVSGGEPVRAAGAAPAAPAPSRLDRAETRRPQPNASASAVPPVERAAPAAPTPPAAPAPTSRGSVEVKSAVDPKTTPRSEATVAPSGNPDVELATLLRYLKDKEHRLARRLDAARALRIEGNTLLASVEPGFAFDELNDAETLRKIDDAARAAIGRGLVLTLSAAEARAPATPKKAAVKAEPADSAQARALRTDALEHASVKLALEFFTDAEVREVKPLAASDEKPDKPEKKGRRT